MSATKTTKTKSSRKARKAAQVETPNASAPEAPKAAKKEPKPKKTSALDAAARVLGESREPMSCTAIIEAMAAKEYWTSPGGKTPAATLYSAIIRELKTKGKEARFQKTDRGRFAL